MNKRVNNFKVNPKKLWLAVIASYMFTILFGYTSFYEIEYSDFLKGVGIGSIISTAVLLFSDIINHNVYNKKFWILSLFIFIPITPLVYMIRRDKLIYLGNKNKYQTDLSSKNNN